MGAKVEDSSFVEKKDNIETQSDTNRSKESLELYARVCRYPKGVFFILGNEFCERFSFYGMRAILMLYIIIEYNFQER